MSRGHSSRGIAAPNLASKPNGTKGANGHAHKVIVDTEQSAAVKVFESAARSFARQNFAKARELFERLAETAPPSVADRARVHLQLCLQRLNHRTRGPKTANDYHMLGVSAINTGQLEEAISYLSKAHRLEPKREETRYALAAAHALQGDADVAIEHLKAAIALRSENRLQARYDEDFRPLAADPRFQSLVQSQGPSRSRWT